MIFWEKLKIQNGPDAGELSLGNGQFTLNKPLSVAGTLSASELSVSTASITNSITLPTNIVFSGTVALPNGTTFDGPVDLPPNSTLQGAVTLPTGSSFASSINILGGSTGQFDTLTVTKQLTVNGQPTINLAEGSTYNGCKIVTWPRRAGFWLDAYQGPGENWIAIRNYTNYTLNISALRFSGNIWADDGNDPAPGDIPPQTSWSRSAYHGWGSNDNPSPITLTYASSNNNTAITRTFSVDEWNASGGILFGEEGTYPGQLLLQNENTLVILYSSTKDTDVQAWYAFALGLGYNQKCTYFGVTLNSPVTTSVGSISENTKLTGTYILTFRK